MGKTPSAVDTDEDANSKHIRYRQRWSTALTYDASEQKEVKIFIFLLLFRSIYLMEEISDYIRLLSQNSDI